MRNNLRGFNVMRDMVRDAVRDQRDREAVKQDYQDKKFEVAMNQVLSLHGSTVTEERQARGLKEELLDTSLQKKFQHVSDVSSAIRESRERLGLTQKELASLVNQKVRVISDCEAGRLVPDANLKQRLEKVLAVKLGLGTKQKRKRISTT